MPLLNFSDIPPLQFTIPSLLAVLALVAALRSFQRGINKTALILLAASLGTIATLAPAVWGALLLVVCGVTSWMAFRRDNDNDVHETILSSRAERWGVITLLSTVAFMLLHSLGSYSSLPLMWEGTVIDGLEPLVQSGETPAQIFLQGLLWGHGTLSAGEESALFGPPTLLLFKHYTASLLSLRIVSLLYFLAACLVFYRFMKGTFGGSAGLLGLAILALNYPAMVYARYGSSVAATLCMLLLALASCTRLIKSLEHTMAAFAPLALFAATLGYSPARVPVTVIAIYTAVTLLCTKRSPWLRRGVACAIFTIMVGGLVLLEAQNGRLKAFFAARGEQFFTMAEQDAWPGQLQTLRSVSGPKEASLSPGEKIGIAIELARQVTIPELLQVLSPLTPKRPLPLSNFHTDPPRWKVLSPSLFPFAIIGAVGLYYSRRLWVNRVLWGWLFASSATLLLTNRIDTHRAFFLIVPLSVWTTVGMTEFFTCARRFISSRLLMAIAVPCTILLAIVPRWNDLYDRSSEEPPQIQSLKSLINEIPGSIRIIADYGLNTAAPIRLALLERQRRTSQASTWAVPKAIVDALHNTEVEDSPTVLEPIAQKSEEGETTIFTPARNFKTAARLLVERGAEARAVKRGDQEFLVVSKVGLHNLQHLGEVLTIPTPQPPVVSPTLNITGTTTLPLSSLKPRDIKADFSPPVFNKAWDNHPLSMAGRTYTSGIGLHAPTVMQYDVPPDAIAFQAIVGLDDDTQSCAHASITFKVMDETGATLFHSGLMTTSDTPAIISIDVEGKKLLTFEATDAGNGRDCDHVDLADAVFVLKPSPTPKPGPASSNKQECVCPAVP